MTTAGEDRGRIEVPTHPGRRWGWLLAAVWLFYLAYPVSDLLGGDHPLWEVVIGLVVTVAFAFTYVLTVRRGFARMNGAAGRHWWAYPAVLLGVAAATALLVGVNSVTYVIFGTTAAIMLWPTAASVPTAVVAVGWVSYGLPLLLGEPPAIELAIITAIVALLMFAIRRMQVQEAVIRRAHEDLAQWAVDAERARFSRDLHDIVGHSLTAIIVKAELAGALAAKRPEGVAGEVGDIERLAREALEDVRRTVAGYRDVTLAGELASARAVLDAAGIEAVLPQAVDEVPGGLRELFGWVVREGVTNVVRHSRANRCEVRVTPTTVEVLDDGRGGKPVTGNGLGGLRERVEAAGGVLDVGPADGGGFRLAAVVPRRAVEGVEA